MQKNTKKIYQNFKIIFKSIRSWLVPFLKKTFKFAIKIALFLSLALNYESIQSRVKDRDEIRSLKGRIFELETIADEVKDLPGKVLDLDKKYTKSRQKIEKNTGKIDASRILIKGLIQNGKTTIKNVETLSKKCRFWEIFKKKKDCKGSISLKEYQKLPD